MSAAQPNGQDVRRMAETIIRTGIADGSLARCDVDSSYHFIIGVLRHLPVWFSGQSEPLDKVSDTLVRFVLQGMGSATAEL
jgi:hypothetical protein